MSYKGPKFEGPRPQNLARGTLLELGNLRIGGVFEAGCQGLGFYENSSQLFFSIISPCTGLVL